MDDEEVEKVAVDAVCLLLLNGQVNGWEAISRIIMVMYGDDDLDAPPATKEAWATYHRLRELTVMPARDIYAALAKREAGNDV